MASSATLGSHSSHVTPLLRGPSVAPHCYGYTINLWLLLACPVLFPPSHQTDSPAHSKTAWTNEKELNRQIWDLRPCLGLAVCMLSPKKPDLSELRFFSWKLRITPTTSPERGLEIWTVSHTIKRGHCTPLFNHTNTFSSECFCSFPVKRPSLHLTAKYIVNAASSEQPSQTRYTGIWVC